jgi:hypothetical protein
MRPWRRCTPPTWTCSQSAQADFALDSGDFSRPAPREAMKEEIETALRPLLGQPLSDMWRYAGYQKFEFGVQRPAKNREGEAVTVADWGLVVACRWAITGPEGLVVSSANFGPGTARRDEPARPFYRLIHADSPVVEGLEADQDGALRFVLSQGYTLEVRPEADMDAEDEQWRFMPPGDERSHFVVWGNVRDSGTD